MRCLDCPEEVQAPAVRCGGCRIARRKVTGARWRAANPGRVQWLHRKYEQENQGRIKKQRVQYYLKNRTRILKRSKQYAVQQAERYQKYQRTYRTENRKELTEKHGKRCAARLKTDARFAITRRLRVRLCLALAGRSKSANTLGLLGCTIDFLKSHLEAQFKPGMTWANRSLWHIDHIRPCASFDLSDPEQQKQCFHYTNLQPLWATDNLMKADKVLTEQSTPTPL